MDKPFKSIVSRLLFLKAVDSNADNNTRLYLEREGYYPVINGYKDLFLDQRGDSCHELFVKGTKFSDIYRLFELTVHCVCSRLSTLTRRKRFLKLSVLIVSQWPIKIARKHTWIEDLTVLMLVIEKRSTRSFVISRRCYVGLKNGKAIIKGTIFGIMRIITIIRRYGFL